MPAPIPSTVYTGLFHTESVTFLITKVPDSPIVLGIPWLSPPIVWVSGMISVCPYPKFKFHKFKRNMEYLAPI